MQGGCKRDENIPYISTASISSITINAAVSGGEIKSDGGGNVTAKGVCWSSHQNPTIADSKTNDGEGTETFNSSITGLNPNTTYYLRAYATNSTGTGYGEQYLFCTLLDSSIIVTDLDGNIYHTVTIGTQIWMMENLQVTRFRNGDTIPDVTDYTWGSLTTPAYCNYDNNANIAAIYGRLYNWYAVNDSRNICPEGWHVPSLAEWNTLIDYVGGKNIAGCRLKEAGNTHWMEDDGDATNVCGFTALPGGWRHENGNCFYFRIHGYWWTSTTGDVYAKWVGMDGTCATSTCGTSKALGFSVRCVKD